MEIVDVLKNSKYCFGPMSKNIVDTIIDIANRYKYPITFIPSRRQIEWNGGYVNNWTTKQFAEYVKTKTKYIAIQRDHGGPGQGLYDDDGYESLKYDCLYFDSIHIDPWKKYSEFMEGVKWTVDMINFCYNLNPTLYFEVGTEEAIRKFKISEINELLLKLKQQLSDKIWKRIIFCVIQSGTGLLDGINIGNYNKVQLNDMINIIKSYGKQSKEHNGDYIDTNDIKSRFNNRLNAINIAPELGVIETKVVLKSIINNQDDINLMYKLCYDSGKWRKWVSKKFIPEQNKHKLIELTGHYVFSNQQFIKMINKYPKLKKNINDHLNSFIIDKYIKLVL